MTSIFGNVLKGAYLWSINHYSSLCIWRKTLSRLGGQHHARATVTTCPAETRHSIILPLHIHLSTFKVDFFRLFSFLSHPPVKYPQFSLFQKNLAFCFIEKIEAMMKTRCIIYSVQYWMLVVKEGVMGFSLNSGEII